MHIATDVWMVRTNIALTNSSRFERFFRIAGGFDVDRMDLRRFEDFLDQETADLLIRAEAIARANDRDIVEPKDIPVTKGLQENMHAFCKLEGHGELLPLFARMGTRPQLELDYSEETHAAMPEIIGGISLALARAFKLIDPDLKNPQSRDWERAYQLFALLI